MKKQLATSNGCYTLVGESLTMTILWRRRTAKEWIRLAATPLLCLCCIYAGVAQNRSHNTVTPAYRIDLKSVFKADATPQLSTRETPWVPVITLNFIDNNTLAATFVVPAKAKPEFAARGKEDDASPFRLESAIFEASSGKVLATPEWPTNSRAAGIVTANDRGFVVETGDQLVLLSSELVSLKQFKLPVCPVNGVNAQSSSWRPDPSWSGNRVLLASGEVWSQKCRLWVDAETMQVLASWQDGKVGSIAVSDDQVVMQAFQRHYGDPPVPLERAAPGGNWKAIAGTQGASAPQFLGPHLLYFQSLPANSPAVKPGVFLMRTDTGTVSQLDSPQQGWGFGRAVPARNGDRFVILITDVKGSHAALDISGHSVVTGIDVYDAPYRSASYSLTVRQSQVRNASAAISPDGRHLAILGYPKPILEIFELPR